MAETIPPQVVAVARAHAAQLAALDRTAQRSLGYALARVEADLRAQLAALPPGALESQRLVLAQLLARAARGAVAEELRDLLADYLNRAGGLAPAHIDAEIGAWLDHHGVASRPLNLGALAAAEEGRGASPWRTNAPAWRSAVDETGRRVADAVQNAVIVGIGRRETLPQVAARVKTAINGETWRAQRIARTEIARAYNAAHQGALEAARAVVPGLKKSALATFDNRTDPDSFPVHGQVRELEDYFVDGDGRRYLSPPGRPNDREKQIPWLDKADAARVLPEEEAAAALEEARAAARAPALDTPEGRAARLSRGWQQGSHGKIGVELREAARRELGLPGALYSRRGMTLDEEAIEATRGDVRAIYNATQADLAERGIRTVRLYRGMTSATDIQGGVESWTTDEEEAARRGGEFGVMVQDVPASRILWSADSPGWSSARRAARGEYLVMADTPRPRFDAGDFEIGFFNASEAGGPPLRDSRGVWGIAGEGEGRTLYHLPSGRSVFTHERDADLIELARRLESRGYVDGRGRLPDAEDQDALRARALEIVERAQTGRYRRTGERAPLAWQRADWDMGGLSARELDAKAERAGIWGILDYPAQGEEPGGVALVERASGRPMIWGAYKREDLRRVAEELDAYVDRNGRLPGEDSPAYGDFAEELASAASFYRRQRLSGYPAFRAGEVEEWIDVGGGLDFPALNAGITGGSGETWSKRIVKSLEESADGDLTIREVKAYVNGNFAIYKTDSTYRAANGYESVDWHLIHLKTGAKLHSGTGMVITEVTSDVVPFRVGGWRLNEFQKVAKGLEQYLNKDGSVKPEREAEWLRDVEFLQRAPAPGEDVGKALGNRYDRDDWITSPISRRAYSRLVEEIDALDASDAFDFLADAPDAEELADVERADDVPF